MDVCSLKAIVRAHGQIHIFNAHFQYFLFGVAFRACKNVCILECVAQIDEQKNVLVKRFCGKTQHFLRG